MIEMKDLSVVTTKIMGPVEWTLLLALSVLWGGSFFFGKVALTELPPFTVVFGRVCLAAIALNIIVMATGNRMPTTASAWCALFGMGLLNNLIPFSLIFWGQTQIASGLASILNSTTPLFAVVLAHWLTQDEKLTTNRMAGVLLRIGGVTVLIGPDALGGLGVNAVAQVAVLGAALSYAFAGIYGRRFRSVPPLVTASGQVTATTVMMLPVMLVVDQPWTIGAPGMRTVAALVGLALLSTALAYVIYFRILAAAGATNLLLVTFLIPVSALILGGWGLGERLESWHWAGMALVASGLVAIDGRLTRLVRRRFEPKGSAAPVASANDYQI
jgi:drug/metabolite transporter (DMT)-like permease